MKDKQSEIIKCSVNNAIFRTLFFKILIITDIIYYSFLLSLFKIKAFF